MEPSSTELEKRKREEYEMQLFGFHSRIVNDTLLSLIQEEIQTKCQQLTETITAKCRPDDEGLKTLLRDEKKLAKCYYRAAKSHLPALENCVNRIIGVPQHLLLDEDKVQALQYSDEEFKERMEKLGNLQKKLKEAIVFNAALKNELEEANDFECEVDAANMLCAIVQDASKVPTVSKTMVKIADLYQDFQRQFLSLLVPRGDHIQCLLTQPPVDTCDIDAIN